jgi:hypothetical protein
VDSERVVKALTEVDPGFVDLCKTLFGDAVTPEDAWEFLYAPGGVEKMTPGGADLHIPGAIKQARGILVPKPRQAAAVKVTRPPKAPAAKQGIKPVTPEQQGVRKDDLDESTIPVTWSGEFSKTDTDKRQAFGWASVVEVDGAPIIDLQGDFITPSEIEKAAYTYVQKSRVGGSQHERDDFDNPVRAGEMIESFVSTPEKIEKMGLPSDFPVGWWVGYQYHDDATWEDIKSGRKTGFSIHGRGKRVPVEV